jgi:hypothetical protein
MASPSLSGGSLLGAALVVVGGGGAPWLSSHRRVRLGTCCGTELAAELTLLAYQQQLLQVLDIFSWLNAEAFIR